MTMAALIASLIETGESQIGMRTQPERPGKCYHDFGDWRMDRGASDPPQLHRTQRSVEATGNNSPQFREIILRRIRRTRQKQCRISAIFSAQRVVWRATIPLNGLIASYRSTELAPQRPTSGNPGNGRPRETGFHRQPARITSPGRCALRPRNKAPRDGS